ncbi:MAG: cytidine deaminase [Alphaproteobacteria bacterium]
MKEALIEEAKKVVGKFTLNSFDGTLFAGTVGSALLAENGKIYTGICMVMACGIGFCAEASAVSLMLKDRITKIKMIVSVNEEGKVVPPCGRCRELLAQVDKENAETDIVISETEVKKLKEILPYNWMDKF